MPTLEEIKSKQQVTWSSGDYSKIAWVTNPLADILCDAVDLIPGSRVLDVATGTGHVALAAARRFCDVTAVDYVPALLEHGRRRAAAENLSVDFREGDAEALEFADGSFDYVLSTIGAMFAPNQPKTASELARACKPGGTIGMINWRPEGFLGELFRTIGKFVPPPPELKPAALWGNPDHVRSLFGDAVSSIEFTEGSIPFRWLSADHYVDFFLEHYGPTLKAFESLPEDQRQAFRDGVTNSGTSFGRTVGDALIFDAEFLIVRATKA